MKKTILMMVLALFIGAESYAVDIVENVVSGRAPYGGQIHKVGLRKEAYETTACPEGTVKGYPFGTESTMAGYCFSDEGYAISWNGQYLTKSCTYVAFSENYYNITGLQFYAQSISVSSRSGCDTRLGKEIEFEIAFYEPGSDGYPDLNKCIYSETVKLTGEDTQLVNAYGHIYKFYTPLQQKVAMNEGYWSVMAKKSSDSGDCCFCLATHNAVDGAGVATAGGIWFATADPPAYCFVSDGTALAERAIKMGDFITPVSNENSFYAPVEFTFTNTGSEPIFDAKFELYLDNKRIATQEYGQRVPSQETCQMRFNARLDLHEGSHTIKVKNVTPSDEHLSVDNISMTTDVAHIGDDQKDLDASRSNSAQYDYINRVKIGAAPAAGEEFVATVDNTSGQPESLKYGYTDCRENQAEMASSDSLIMYVQGHVYDNSYVGVWVDWNSDGVLDETEKVGSMTNAEIGHYKDDIADDTMGSFITVKLPEGTQAAPGNKTMRIILNADEEPKATGVYKYGETEDYTIVLLGDPENSCISVAENYLNLLVDSQEGLEDSYEISNIGGKELTVDVSMGYRIPNSPAVSSLANNPASGVQLNYSANESTHGLGITSNDVSWGCYYPATMTSAVKGMTLTSVDVNVADLCVGSSIEIYGPGNGINAPGQLLTSQSFTPTTSNAWNRVVLDNPVLIDGTDLWIVARFTGGFQSSEGVYQINSDNGPVAQGYGDRLLFSGYWWSTSELDDPYPYNLCLRGNLTGTPTSSVNWFTITDKVTVPAGGSVELPYSINMEGLSKGLYEGTINLATNDPLQALVQIPVWLEVDKAYTKIETVPMNTAHIYTSGSELVIKSEKEISSVSVIDMSGRTCNYSLNNHVGIRHLVKSPYVVRVVYTDGTEEKTTMLLK